MTASRLSRFGDWTPLEPLVQSGGNSGARPFYSGSQVDDRMEKVRAAIEHIRLNWDDYPRFMHELRDFMRTRVAGLDTRADALFTSTKQWADEDTPRPTEEYSAVRLYTSAAGYAQMFETINLAFRDDELTTRADALRCAVFLVELLTVDLFNYRSAHPDADNFEGRVYRGMLATKDDLRKLALVASAPVDERYVAVPLAMASASTDRDSALRFVSQRARYVRHAHAVLWEIDVAALSPPLLQLYTNAYPLSVVSSICAVPIEQLSDYPEEREVLLRGPFFQIIRVREDEHPLGNGTPLRVVEALMLSANRDHRTSVGLGPADGKCARELFRSLVAIDRSRRCAERAEHLGLHADVRAYLAAGRSQRARLDRLLEASAA